MMPVVELERAHLVEAVAGTRLESSVTVVTETAAGSPDVRFFNARQATGELTCLSGEAYPALVAVWDNEDDAIFDIT